MDGSVNHTMRTGDNGAMGPESETRGYPTVEVIDETMREGMQIERASIATKDKVRLLDGLSGTGLKTIVVGSFVSPRWVPQMHDIDEILERFTPRPGVSYRALAMNDKGRERRGRHAPPLTEPSGELRHATRVHLSDVFVKRNTNRSQQDEIARWPDVVQRARDEGASRASMEVNAAWGSNWEGTFTLQQRMEMLERQHQLWDDAGAEVTRVWLGDPMGWNLPTEVRDTVAAVTQRWPEIKTVHLHLHDTRGLALLSAFAAMEVLSPCHRLVIDTSIGGIGGCPYCGNGRATGMIPTEDLVHMLEEMGIVTGVDLDRLVGVTHLAERIVGRRLDSHVARAGRRPHGDRRYSLDLPLIETFADARHFVSGL